MLMDLVLLLIVLTGSEAVNCHRLQKNNIDKAFENGSNKCSMFTIPWVIKDWVNYDTIMKANNTQYFFRSFTRFIYFKHLWEAYIFNTRLFRSF